MAILSGGLQVLIFPSPSLGFLAWIALAPLLVAILRPTIPGSAAHTRQPRLRAFLLGYVSGVVWYAGSCYWIYHVMNSYGGLPPVVAIAVLLLFCLYLALYHGVFGLLLWTATRAGNANAGPALLLSPFVWVAVELARARITGFPWDLLGTAQVGNIALTRVAMFTAVYGLSFEIVLVNAGFAAAFLVPLRARRTLVAGVLAVAALLQAGNLFRPGPAASGRVATLVQVNIPILEEDQWTPEYMQQTVGEVERTSVPAARDAEAQQGIPGLIVWPESPAPFFATDRNFRASLSHMAQLANAYVVAGSLGLKQTPGEERPRLFNSAALVAPSGEWVAHYDKIHLVPFGEYVPYRQFFSFAGKLTREVGDFSPGSTRQPLDLGSFKLGVFICYESIFPDEVRQFARNGGEAFINISNDSWFGPTGAPGQHLNMVRMRAIENRRWVLRSTNTGITAAIDPYGRVVAVAPAGQRVALNAPYARSSETTFYTRHGDWFAFGCAIITVAGLLFLHYSRGPGPLIWTRN
ncbi:MAG: apolipoprotein N-acyltransferase [Acidobacteria bacterium]|nr:apolipoprotein N-acyltransferase [Acidobacteriota bacterium]